MKVLTLVNGVTSQEVLQIETPLTGFLIESDALGTMFIEVVRVTKSGSTTIIPKMPVLQAAEMGVIDGYEIIPADDTGADDAMAFVPIVDEGVLDNSGGYLTLRIYKDAVDLGSVYGLESIGKVTRSYKYDLIHLNANTPKEVSVIEAQGIIIDLMNTTSLEMRFVNGDRVKYDNAEIRYLSGISQEKMDYMGSGVFGHGEYCAFRIDEVQDVNVTASANSSIVVVK